MNGLMRVAALLVLPLAALLFAQWPLRDWVQAGSRQANDLAQIFFALYMACAVTAATRAGIHLSTGHGKARLTRARAWVLLACVGPWAFFVLAVSAGPLLQSLGQLEKFSETLNPGYFLIRVALWLLALLVLVDGVLAVRRMPPHG